MPVVPEVYMMIARSLGLGGDGFFGFCWPLLIRASSVITSTPALEIVATAAATSAAVFRSGTCGASAMYTTFLSSLRYGRLALSLKTFASTLSSFASATTTLALVWRAPCRKPSSPSVA